MAFHKQSPELDAVTSPPCAVLRSKAIYVTGNLDSPNHDDEVGGDQCWCNLTQHILGPDGQLVGRQECHPGRDCYRES